MPAWAPRLGWRLRIAHLGIVRHLGRERLGRFGGGVGHLLARDLGLVDTRLGILGLLAFAILAGLALALVLLALGALLLVGFRRAVLAHVEIVEEIVHHVAEARLVLDQLFQPVEILAGAILEQWAPEFDQAPRRRRRRHAGQALTHQHGERLLDRR